MPDLGQAHETWGGVKLVKGKNQRIHSSNGRTIKIKQKVNKSDYKVLIMYAKLYYMTNWGLAI